MDWDTIGLVGDSLTNIFDRDRFACLRVLVIECFDLEAVSALYAEFPCLQPTETRRHFFDIGCVINLYNHPSHVVTQSQLVV